MSSDKVTTEYLHKTFLDPNVGMVGTTKAYDDLAENYNKLYASGFTQLDGLDPSQGMLDVAKSKGIYGELLCAYVALGDEKLNIPDNTYDGLTICGSMGVNMVPPEGIYEMHRLVKPGGIIVNVVRQETVNEIEGFKDRLEPMMQQMEADGKWKLVSRVLFPDYLVDQGGVIFTHQVC
ncbi:Williams-Beuren syndrome chromosomal region 27 protein [Elysia marginata]|uniref:Williams-Beuren syndrome chromosomal region 27 protein n=1 Tax=Elysia marginata TaxID=1093978 RepID=A0AAV4IRQ3_9GAST|nr:Williams-Beuren syndrome chromosomal region 27 protein [Elysia marginata]